MMNTKKSKLTTLKKAISIPVLLLAFGLFVQKTYANTIENIIKETQKNISEPERKPISENIVEMSPETQPESLIEEKTTKSEPIETTNDEKIIQDTIRPKSSQNVNTTSKTLQNKNSNISENEEVTVVPQYPGGINEMRNKLSKSFDGSKINVSKTKEIYRTELTYTITEDGNVVDIKTMGTNELFNNEALSALKKANENITWKPAEKDGKPVRYRMRIPLTMSFQ